MLTRVLVVERVEASSNANSNLVVLEWGRGGAGGLRPPLHVQPLRHPAAGAHLLAAMLMEAKVCPVLRPVSLLFHGVYSVRFFTTRSRSV